jgi:hypothetical protein
MTARGTHHLFYSRCHHKPHKPTHMQTIGVQPHRPALHIVHRHHLPTAKNVCFQLTELG